MADGPKTVADWIRYLHAASQEPRSSPHYAESRQAMAAALRHINALQVGATMQGATEAEHVGPVESVAGGLLHGAGLGTGELFRGAGRAIEEGVKSTLGQPALPEGQAFRQGAQEYRDALNQMEASHPGLTPTAELIGGAALPAARVGQLGARGIQAGVPLTIGQGAARIGEGALTGGVTGAVSGFAGGGSDPGDIGARAQGAGQGAILGLLLGGLGTAATLPRARGHVEHVADIRNQGTMRALQEQRLRNAQAVGNRIAGSSRELPPTDIQAIERELQADQSAPEPVHPDISQAIDDFEAGKISGEDLRTAMDVAHGRVPPEPPAKPSPLAPSIQGMSPEEIAADPMSQAPPVEQSAAAPGVQEGQVRRVAEGMLARERAPAKIVRAGRYQRAAPSTRMLSTPEGPSLIERALMQNPDNPGAVLRTQLELGRLFGAPASVMRAVEDALHAVQP